MTALPARVARALARVNPAADGRPRAVVVASDPRGLALAAERCDVGGYALAAVADARTALAMLCDGRADVVVAGRDADLPGVEVADRPRRARQDQSGLGSRDPKPGLPVAPERVPESARAQIPTQRRARPVYGGSGRA